MYIQLNSQILYYTKSGEGSPVILLHGNGETHEIFDKLIPALEKEHTVYAIDTRGHGLSATPKELHYMDMAADVAAFIDALELPSPAVYGFSDGAIVGLLVEMNYRGRLGRLIISGANLNPKQLKMGFLMEIKKQYRKTHSPLLELMLTEPNIQFEQLRDVRIPTLVLAGEKDIVKKEVTEKIAASILNSVMMILPGETHGSYVEHSDKLAPIILDFLRS